MNIILFGPPGAGKGTQAKYLKNKLNNFQVSTGDILRDEIKKESEIGKKIISYMNDGKFVDDEIINKLIKNIIFDKKKKDKLIFDGYPRTMEQVKNLNLWLTGSDQKIDFIFFLNVNKETIIERIKKRKIIENRTDDDLETILKRHDTYMETTKPVLDFYAENPNFHDIDGSLEIHEITMKIQSFLDV